MQKTLKQRLRKKFLAKREKLSKKFVESASAKICAKLVATGQFRGAKTILFYYPVRNEVDCLAAMKEALSVGKRVFLPRIRGWDFQVVEVKSLMQLEKISRKKGTFGVPEPRGKRTPLGKIGLVVVPGVAFDRRGNRMGYGGGYYDELLGKKEFNGTSIGVCYASLLVNKLPSEAHDKRVNIIITEPKVIRKLKK